MTKTRIESVLLGLTACLLTLVSCANPSPETMPPVVLQTATLSPDTPPVRAVPFTTIAQEAPLGDTPGAPLYTLVAEAGDWEGMRGQLPDKAIEAGIRADQLGDAVMVVAFAGAMGSSGYVVTVESISLVGDQVTLTVSQTGPGPDDIVEPAYTLPYHLVAIAEKNLPSTQPLTFVFLDSAGALLHSETVVLP